MPSVEEAAHFNPDLLGEKITLHATVRAGRHEGFYDVVTAAIHHSMDPQALRTELLSMVAEDLRVREEMVRDGALFEGISSAHA